jgi:ABC-type phosphate transport system permease subunit
MGSLWVVAITVLFSFPIGVGAAIYLEEYASPSFINRTIQTNINNLAGVPSIIYGMLGLAIFVRTLEPLTSGALFGVGDGTTANGRTILSAGLTLGLLILPVIIIAAQEAIRAVPQSLRQAGMALGGDQMANHLGSRAAQRLARHPHRHHPGHLTRHWRDGPAGGGGGFYAHLCRSRRPFL